MYNIEILNPGQRKPNELTIDIAVELADGLHRITKIVFGNNELYFIPTTHEKNKLGIDLKTSYHGTGVIHIKLIRGKLKQATWKIDKGKSNLLEMKTLGESDPSQNQAPIYLWKGKGLPLNQIKGTQSIFERDSNTTSMVDLNLTASSYPLIERSKADYLFKIVPQISAWYTMDYYLIEPDNISSLQLYLDTYTERWRTDKRPLLLSSVRVDVFKNLYPWLGIAIIEFHDSK